MISIGQRGRFWLGVGAVVSLLAGAGLLLDEVLEGATKAFDTAILLALRTPGNPSDPVGPPWFEEAARDVTALGSFTLLFALVAFVALYLVLHGRPRSALFLVVSSVSGAVLSTLLKIAIDRPRPDITGAARVFTASFPSGHALISAGCISHHRSFRRPRRLKPDPGNLQPVLRRADHDDCRSQPHLPRRPLPDGCDCGMADRNRLGIDVLAGGGGDAGEVGSYVSDCLQAIQT